MADADCWSTSDEGPFVTDFEDVCERAFDNAHPDKPETVEIYAGVSRKLSATDMVPSGCYLVDLMRDQAHDQVGEIACDWLHSLSKADENKLHAKVAAAVHEWLRETGNPIRFWAVDRVHTVTVRQVGEHRYEEA